MRSVRENHKFQVNLKSNIYLELMFSSTRIYTIRALGTFWKDLFAKAWENQLFRVFTKKNAS